MARASRPAQGPRWFDLSQRCRHCGEEDWSSEFCERTLLVCTCCGVGCAHVGCEAATMGHEYGEEFVESGCDWFCCEVGRRAGRPAGGSGGGSGRRGGARLVRPRV
jgi:hypothetical protein